MKLDCESNHFSSRLFDIRNLNHHHDLSAQMLKLIPDNKNTF